MLATSGCCSGVSAIVISTATPSTTTAAAAAKSATIITTAVPDRAAHWSGDSGRHGCGAGIGRSCTGGYGNCAWRGCGCSALIFGWFFVNKLQKFRAAGATDQHGCGSDLFYHGFF